VKLALKLVTIVLYENENFYMFSLIGPFNACSTSSSDGKLQGGTLPTTPAAPVTVLTDAEALDQVQKMHVFLGYAEPNSS
jgi:hypothetical protein